MALCSTISIVRAIPLVLLTAVTVLGQNVPSGTRSADQSPPVKVNVLNVCTPSGDEQQQLKEALAKLPRSLSFDIDYEISRGISTIESAASARYVRLRREVKSDSPLVTVQYSLSADPENTVETVVFRGREAKELLALSIENKLSTAVSRPATVIESDTPASRVRLERAGKTTVALTRCEGVDQSRYEPIFAQASSVFADYRRILKLRAMLANDIAWLGAASSPPRSSTGAKTGTSGESGDHPH